MIDTYSLDGAGSVKTCPQEYWLTVNFQSKTRKRMAAFIFEYGSLLLKFFLYQSKLKYAEVCRHESKWIKYKLRLEAVIRPQSVVKPTVE